MAYFKYTDSFSSFLETKRLRHREMKVLVQGHTARMWLNRI